MFKDPSLRCSPFHIMGHLSILPMLLWVPSLLWTERPAWPMRLLFVSCQELWLNVSCFILLLLVCPYFVNVVICWILLFWWQENTKAHLVFMEANTCITYTLNCFTNFGAEIRLSGLLCLICRMEKPLAFRIVVSSFPLAWKILLGKPTRIQSVHDFIFCCFIVFMVSLTVLSSPAMPSRWKSVPKVLKAASPVPGVGYASSMGFVDNSESVLHGFVLCLIFH